MSRLAVSRRRLRLASGLLLFGYISTHFVCHALGLVSLAVAERALALAVRVWHSAPGSLLLVGAAAVHVALALEAVYARRTLRMPPLQALRIAMGFAMPMLVIGHVVATRLAADLYGLPPTYSRIVWALWLSDGEGQQLALLAPGWIHGCLGLQMAFGQRPGWQRLRPVAFGLALLLPVLAGLGFLAMGRELASQALALQAPATAAHPAAAIALARLRDHGVAGWLALVAAVFAARELRGWVERRRRLVVNIAYPQHRVAVPRGWSVLEASRSFGLPHLSQCGGRARCSTCRVRVVAGAAHCPPPAAEEQACLRRMGAGADVRLACQLRPGGDIAVVPLLQAPARGLRGAEVPVSGAEHELALMRVVLVCWQAWAPTRPSPHDHVHALNQWLDAVGTAVLAAGADHWRGDGSGASAVFGRTTSPAQACGQACEAAERLGRALDALNLRLQHEVGLSAHCAIAVHTGNAVIGTIGHGRERVPEAVGEAVFATRALGDRAAQADCRFAISRDAAAQAGRSLDAPGWEMLDRAHDRPPLVAWLGDRLPALA
jgi:adenylate cyclase